MPKAAPPDETLRPALEALAAADADLARAYAGCGLPPVRRQDPGFAGLIRMITGQQVSVASARAIIGRLEAAARPLTPRKFLALDDGDLRAIGFSRQKVVYGRALAEDILARRLNLKALPDRSDAEVAQQLLQVKGIGRWTTDIYLLFALQRPDIWPVDDLAVVVATQRLKGLDERPDRKTMLALGEAWRPHRSAAARLLWHYYRHPGVA